MKIQLSNIAISIVILACLVIDFSLKNWEKQDRVIEWDVHSYYAYLPALFIYDDINLAKDKYIFGKNYYLFWPTTTDDGKQVIKTSMGLSILYSPFFFVAHVFAKATNYPDNGFSEPYKFFLLLSAIFYLLIGLNYLRKILQHYGFSDSIISITVLLVGLGTNLLCYSSESAPMGHVYSFCLFSIFIYFTIKWYEIQSLKRTIVLGLLLGLITLIRPTNGVIMIFFALYGLSEWDAFEKRITFLSKSWIKLGIMCLAAVLVWVPQFIYWKVVTGNYLYYAYTDERFFFNDPKLIAGLFGFRKGWLLYTPMMAFALAGIFLMKEALSKLKWAIGLFLVVNIYIMFSWWAWWYGGTYGQRSMIEAYALLSLPFASFIKFVGDRKWYWNALFYSVALFFIWLNIFQTYQFEYHSLHWDGMTKDLYFKQFGKLDRISDYDKYVSSPDYKAAQKNKDHLDANEILADQAATAAKQVSGKKIHLKGLNGKYVCADKTQNNNVLANSNNPWEWETFSLISLGKDQYAIQAYNKRYFSVELNQQKEISAIREKQSTWEVFTMFKLDSNLVAFKGVNDKYLSVDEKSLMLFAKGDSIGPHEKFILIPE